jgi:antitoxin (DNA-binding transcriptional repressor) of toxin-antitoxin stability system
VVQQCGLIPQNVPYPLRKKSDGGDNAGLLGLIVPARIQAMSTISVQEIRRNPDSFIGRLEAGETLVVMRGDDPLAEVRPLEKNAGPPRPFGLCAGQFRVPDDFDAPLPEKILREFEG